MKHTLIYLVTCSLVPFVEYLKSIVQLVHCPSTLKHFIAGPQLPSPLSPAADATCGLAVLMNGSVMSTFSVGQDILCSQVILYL